MRLIFPKFIHLRLLQSLISRLPSLSGLLRSEFPGLVLWLWHRLLRLCNYTGKQPEDKGRNQAPTTHPGAQDRPWEKSSQVGEEAHEVLHTSVPSTSVAPSEEPSLYISLTPSSPTPISPLPVTIMTNSSHAAVATGNIDAANLQVTLETSPQYGVKDVFCIHPGAMDRWDKRIQRSKVNRIQVLPPITFTFGPDDLPDGWISHVHPEGLLYFYKDVGPHRYITEAYLYNPATRDEITSFLNLMELNIGKQREPLPETFEIVLELRPNWDAWGYYMVDCSSRCVLWMTELDVLWAIGKDFLGLEYLSHFKHWIDVSYWRHWELFPAGKTVPSDVMKDLTGILQYGGVDLMTSLDSTVIWTSEQTAYLLSLVKGMEDTRETDYVTAAISRLMWFMANEKFLNFHGQLGARIGRDQSMSDDTIKKHSFFIKLLSPFLFGAPYGHLRQLERMWIDEKVTLKHWKQHVQMLKDEWIETILYSTVLFSVNVSFLAIPLLTPNQNNGPDSMSTSSPGQIAGLVSVIANVGCIVIGLILIRQHRALGAMSMTELSEYLVTWKSPGLGLEPVAVISSLPFAFFMWGMIAFIVALMFLCFDAVNSLRQRVITAAVWVLVVIPIVWIVISAWKSGSDKSIHFIWNIRRISRGLDQNFQGEEDDDSRLEPGKTLRNTWKSKTEKLRKIWRRQDSSNRKLTNSTSQVRHPDSY